MLFRCSECKRSKIYDKFQQGVEDGWMFITLTNGGMGWICPACSKRHRKILERIRSVLQWKKS